MNSENLTYINDSFEQFRDFEYGLIINKQNKKLIQGIQAAYAESHDMLNYYLNNWVGFEDGNNYINKTVVNPLYYFSFMCNFNTRPYAFIDENNEESGFLIQLFYGYARNYYADLSVKKTFTDEDLIPAVLNSTVNMSVGFIALSKIDSSKIAFINSQFPTTPIFIIRYDNGDESLGWELPNSVQQFDGMFIGSLPGQDGLIKHIFKNTGDDLIYTAPQSGELFNYLLSENIDAILTDELLVEFFEKKVVE